MAGVGVLGRHPDVKVLAQASTFLCLRRHRNIPLAMAAATAITTRTMPPQFGSVWVFSAWWAVIGDWFGSLLDTHPKGLRVEVVHRPWPIGTSGMVERSMETNRPLVGIGLGVSEGGHPESEPVRAYATSRSLLSTS